MRSRLAAPAVLAVLALLVPAPLPAAATVQDWVPALHPLAADLADHDVVKDPQTGVVLLRFANAIANTGPGALVIVGQRAASEARDAPADDNRMPAYQRITRSDGSTRDVLVGELLYHPVHHHFHFDGASRYELLDDHGDVVRQSAKVSFCLADVEAADAQPAGTPKAPKFNSCAHNARATEVTMGVSVGWADVYGKDLVGQNFDVTALMAGPQRHYTLRATTNPLGLLLDSTPGASASADVVLGEGVEAGVGGERPGV